MGSGGAALGEINKVLQNDAAVVRSPVEKEKMDFLIDSASMLVLYVTAIFLLFCYMLFKMWGSPQCGSGNMMIPFDRVLI